MVPSLLLFLLPFSLLFASSSAAASKAVKNNDDFVFLTFSNGTDAALEVNAVVASSTKTQFTLASQLAVKNANQTKEKMTSDFSALQQSPSSSMFSSFLPSSSSGAELPVYFAKTANLSAKDGSIEYKMDGITAGLVKTNSLFPKGKEKYELKVCVFGDFAQNLYEQAEMNLGDLVGEEKCQLNLFIGKIAWERQLQPRPMFAFSPYVMLHSQANSSKHLAFARVPSIFGQVGGNQTETSFFQSTEVGDVAFIQITVEIATVADLQDGTEAYEMISQYFRELMLNELECKLQELHRRPKRPWIVLYMTHPYLVSNDEDKVQWFVMNDTNRFFEILKRYKVDLLTSCGIEGMSRMLQAERLRTPDAKLPEYIQTTMAQCGGYQSVDVTLQNECTYAVLDILPERMTFQKKMAEGEGTAGKGGKAAKSSSSAAAKSKGKIVAKGEIVRNYDEPDQCVPSEEL